jgi:hypothetical protein
MRWAPHILCLSLLALAQPARARVRFRTQPSPIVLKEGPVSVVIHVQGLPGVGPVKAAANVGRIDAIEPTATEVNVLYTTPIERRFPQVLCLVLWRGEEVVEVARIPLRSLPSPRVDRTYNQVTLAAGQERIAVAVVLPGVKPVVTVDGEPVSLRRRAPGLWIAPWGDHRGRVTVRAWLPDAHRFAREASVELVPRFEAHPTPIGRRRVALTAGLGVGMLHNTGELLAPRFAAELGLDFRLPAGWLGLRALVGVSWGAQQVRWPGGEAEADVVLLPVGGALCYTLPRWVVTPYVAAGVLAQVVRTTSTVTGPDLERVDQVDHEVVLALLGQVGIEAALGPGSVFLQTGFLWSRVESPSLEMLAGGVIVEAGYRFRL